MNPSTSNPNRTLFQRALRIVLIGSGLCLAPFVILALVALSYFGLPRDAAALRQQIFAATPAGWSTKVQVNLGESTLGAANLGLRFVDNENIAQAREFLAAVKRASVGVYERDTVLAKWSRPELFAMTDRVMEKRGWARLVGVVDGKSTVLVYGPQRMTDEQSVEICVAVIDGKDLVVASAKVDTNSLDELIRKNGLGQLHGARSFLALK